MVRETGVQFKVETYQIALDTAWRNYKLRIKGKVEQSRERSSAFPYNIV